MRDGAGRLIGRLVGVGGVPAVISEERALGHLRDYFAVGVSGRLVFSGAAFETFGAGGLAEPDRFVPEDLLAPALLSKPVPGQAVLGLLGAHAEEASALLRRLPVEARFEALNEDAYEKIFGPAGAAARLWDLLRQREVTWGVGPTGASKLMARKRPHLVPVYDSFVRAQAGLVHQSRDQWLVWRQAFEYTVDGRRPFCDVLKRLRKESGQEHLSLLRVLDIVLWMEQLRTNQAAGHDEAPDEADSDD